MPELPDVESFRKYMDSTSLNKKIENVDILKSRILTQISPAALKKNLKGNSFKSTKRHGKNLFAELSNKKWVTMHFGMTGFLKYYKDDQDASSHIRLLINFNNGYHLAYDSLRMLGRVGLVNNISEYIKKKKLGPDPIEDRINFKTFFGLFKNRSSSIKTALMDQSILAGIGNIYSDEILFQAGIHPGSNIKNLNEDDFKKIFKQMNTILKKAILVNADAELMPDNYLLNYRKPGKDCPKCSGKIKRETIGGRSSYYCYKHQKKK